MSVAPIPAYVVEDKQFGALAMQGSSLFPFSVPFLSRSSLVLSVEWALVQLFGTNKPKNKVWRQP